MSGLFKATMVWLVTHISRILTTSYALWMINIRSTVCVP